MESLVDLRNLELHWTTCIGWKWHRKERLHGPFERTYCGIITRPPPGVCIEQWEHIVASYIQPQHPSWDIEFKYEGRR